MNFLIAQTTAPPPPPNSGINIDPSAISGLGGIGLIFWVSWQAFVKVWEKKATNQIATESVRSEAEIDQEKQALGTLVEVFRNTSEASVELQRSAFKANSDLISQLSSIRANAAEVHYESIKDELTRLADNQKEANTLQRQYNIALVDLAEVIKRIEWRIDNATGHTNHAN